VLLQVTVFTGVALETSVLPRDVIANCCIAALGAVLLDTARSKHRFPYCGGVCIRSRAVYRSVPRNELRNQQWVDMSQYQLQRKELNVSLCFVCAINSNTKKSSRST
jgi:hypothetical protein